MEEEVVGMERGGEWGRGRKRRGGGGWVGWGGREKEGEGKKCERRMIQVHKYSKKD